MSAWNYWKWQTTLTLRALLLTLIMQNFETSTATFNDGVTEGDRFLALLLEICPAHTDRCAEFSTVEQMQPIYDYLVARSERYAYPYLEGFLSRAIKPAQLEAEIITLWGADKFIENQTQYAPVCEFPDERQIVQFGYVSGDGDAWCIDLKFQEIVCISHEADGSSDDSARRYKAGVFPAFDYLTSFLRTDAERRGWLERKKTNNHA